MKTRNAFTIIIITSLILMLSACKKEDNNNTCNEPADCFVGSYLGTKIVNGSPTYNYTVEITKVNSITVRCYSVNISASGDELNYEDIKLAYHYSLTVKTLNNTLTIHESSAGNYDIQFTGSKQ